jgi:hypothetical protein
MKMEIRFENKGLARLIDTDGDYATLECDFSSPPGSPLSGVILETNRQVRIKVRDCRRSVEDTSRYQLRGRWVNLSRATRDALLGSPAEKPVP